MQAWVGVTGLFTVVLAVSSVELWIETRAAGKRADLAIRTIERACVKMSHKSAGLTIDENGTTCKVTLQIKNPLICKGTLGFGLAGAIVALQCDMNECM